MIETNPAWKEKFNEWLLNSKYSRWANYQALEDAFFEAWTLCFEEMWFYKKNFFDQLNYVESGLTDKNDIECFKRARDLIDLSNKKALLDIISYD